MIDPCSGPHRNLAICAHEDLHLELADGKLSAFPSMVKVSAL